MLSVHGKCLKHIIFTSHTECIFTAEARSKTGRDPSVRHTAVLDSENIKPTTPMVDNRAGSDKESRCLVSESTLFCIHSNGHCSNGILHD